MYAITGITGKVGGALANALLDSGVAVRAVVRDTEKARAWASRGCEVAIAEMGDARALVNAFTGVKAVFILPPSDFDPEPGYPAARRVITALVDSLTKAKPARVVCLSTVGADAIEDNLLTQRAMLEQALGAATDIATTFLRAAWFLDNAQWDVMSAREEGVIRSFLHPLDRKIPMVAARDVGVQAAELMREAFTGHRVVRLEGPSKVSPDDIAAAFTKALGHPVHAAQVPREDWAMLFRAQGMRNPEPRIRMLDGFNEGWISFGDAQTLKGTTTVDDVVADLVRGR